MAQPLTTADHLECLAGQLHSVAFDFREPARSIQFAEQRIEEVERICAQVRAVVRGGKAIVGRREA